MGVGKAATDRRTFLGGVAATAAALSSARAWPSVFPSFQAEASGADAGSLFPAVLELADRGEYPFSFLNSSFSDLDDWRERARGKIFDLFHYDPPAVAPDAEVVGRWETEDHVQERIEFSTAPWFRVPASVLASKRFSGRRPAIVDLHSHGGMFLFGREKVMPMPDGDHPAIVEYRVANYEGRSTSLELCRRGYVVISIDAFYFGERRTVHDDLPADLRGPRGELTTDQVLEANRRAARGEATLAKSLFWGGTTWPGIVHWDDIRTIDYLATRADVDPLRIGCLGVSMGGDRTNYLAALDDRVRCAVSVGWMSTLREMMRAHVDTHSLVHFLPGMTRFLDLPDLLGCMAPRPLMVQYCTRDALYPPRGMELSREKLEAVYDKAGASDRFQARFHQREHIFSRDMQEEAFDWLDRWLRP